jgi:lysophospholipase L1-like esterase
MTVEVQTPYNEHTGNGVTTTFGYTFLLLDADDLKVYVNGALVASADYTVSGVGVDAGGSVVFDTAPASGAEVLLSRELPLTRETDYQTLGDLRASTLNDDLDRLWQVGQQQDAKLGGVLRAPYPEQLEEMPAAADRADKLLSFDADGNPIAVAFADQSASVLQIALAEPTGSELIGYDSETLAEHLDRQSPRYEVDTGAQGLFMAKSAVLILGDSITAGSGASSYPVSYSYLVARSIWAAVDGGYGADPGYGYQTTINMANAVSEGNISTTGSFTSAGVVSSRLMLAAGQSLTVTGRAVRYGDVIYDADASSGNLVIALNGTTISTESVSGTGLQHTFPTSLHSVETLETDTLTFTASGGTWVICGLFTLKESTRSPTVYVVGKSGTAYQDYNTATPLAELAYYLNLFRTSDPKLVVLNLGTNNLYNAGKSKTPAQMVTEIGALITGLNALATNILYAIAVPPKANEATFPIIASGYAYEDYVDAIVAFARTNKHALIRHDKSLLSTSTSYYSDGVHPNTTGHRIMAKTVCDALGIALKPVQKSAAFATRLAESQGEVTMNDTWRAFSNNTSFRAKAHKVGDHVLLSGLVEPNGSVSTTVMTLPSGYRPVGRTIYLCAADSGGIARFTINTSGVVTLLTAVPSTYLSFDNVKFAITRT